MRNFIIAFITILFVISCSNQTGSEPIEAEVKRDSSITKLSEENYYTFINDSVEIPPFEVELSLSQKAEAKLKEGKETIIVRAFFTGQPKDTSLREFQKHGEIFITSSEKELFEARLAKFSGVRFSKKEYNSLSNKNISVTINVFSGRKFYQDNLLDIPAVFDSTSNIKGRKFLLQGKLIYGDD
jgi:hypothetical protein